MPAPLPEPPNEMEQRSSAGSWLWMSAVAGLVALCVVLISLMVLRSDSGDTSPSASETTDVTSPTTVSSIDDAEPVTTSDAPTTAPSFASTDDDGEVTRRSANLFAGLAMLRTEPDLDASKVTELRNQDGAALTVFGDIRSGWYEVSVGGLEGWIFGAFVTPADEGYAVAISSSRLQEVVLRDANGSATGEANPSGNKVLIAEIGSDLHRVVMPDGSSRYVRARDVDVVN